LSKVVLFMFLFFFQVIQLCPCQDSGVCLGIPTPLFFVKLHTEKIRSILDPKDIKQPRKCPFYQHFRGSVRYSNSRFIRVFLVISYFCSPHFCIIFLLFFLFLSFRFIINIIITSQTNTVFLFFVFFNFYPIIEKFSIYNFKD